MYISTALQNSARFYEISTGRFLHYEKCVTIKVLLAEENVDLHDCLARGCRKYGTKHKWEKIGLKLIMFCSL